MCGIAGIVLKKANIINLTDAMKKMLSSIAHRGPDGEGIFIENNIAFGHRRLAIIDVASHSNQPMLSENNQYILIYNGEIYNYKELKEALTQKGYIFRTSSDTEVILVAYQHWGKNCVNYFNGMWAFALFDKLNQRLFISRDRFGVKPLYYINTDDYFIFCSEIKPILPFLNHTYANTSVIIDYLVTSISDHHNQTFFKDINKLSQGHNGIYRLDSHQLNITPFYELTYQKQFNNYSISEAKEHFLTLLTDAVRLRLRSDVKVGSCLSGGLDSSSIVALASQLYGHSSEPFSAITAVSEQPNNDESHYAKLLINQYPLNWLTVKPSFNDFYDNLNHVVTTQEEPFGGPSIFMQYFVMKTAKKNGIKVLLDGQGGDEILLGYEKYYGNFLLSTLKNDGVKGLYHAITSTQKNNEKLSFLKLMAYLIATSSSTLRYQFYRHRHRYLLKKPPFFEHLSLFSNYIWNDFALQSLEIKSTNLPVLLRYEDKNSMAHGIETRLPFLDYRLVEFALSIQNQFKIRDGWSKWLLRETLSPYLPNAIAWRKNKFGFEAPENIWLTAHLPDMTASIQKSPIIQSLTNQSQLTKQYPKLDKRTQWRLYNLSLWEKLFRIAL
jgi:asparagine synthase (glutamine-hydrolysing)